MNTERNPSPEKPGPRRAGRLRWRIAAFLLLAFVIAGLLVATGVLLPSDPVKREVALIVHRVRKEERGQRPWQALFENVRQWLFQKNNTSSSSPNPSEELYKLGERAHPFLVPLVGTDPSRAVRKLAIETLADGNATNAFPVIALALEKDTNVEVRAAAASAVSQLDPNAAEPLLLAALARERRQLDRSKGTTANPWMESRAIDAIARALGTLKATNALEPLLELLQSNTSSNVRGVIADALGELGDPRAAPALRSLPAAKDQTVRRAAIHALGLLRDRESLPLLLGLMEEAITNTQSAVAASAGQASYRQPASGWEWQDALRTLAGALGRIGDKRATPMLVRAATNAVQETELETFIEAFASLGDPQAIPVLQAIMADHPKLAKDAADTLVLLGHRSVKRELTALLEAPEREKRVAAAMALANLGDKSVLTNLMQAMATEAGSENSQHLVEALGIIGDATTVPPLVTALKDPQEEVRTQAAWALGNISDPSAAGPLIQSLADTNFYVRFAASFALIGMTNSAISSALEALFNDPEPRVRTAAAISVAFHGSTRAIPQLATRSEEHTSELQSRF